MTRPQPNISFALRRKRLSSITFCSFRTGKDSPSPQSSGVSHTTDYKRVAKIKYHQLINHLLYYAEHLTPSNHLIFYFSSLPLKGSWLGEFTRSISLESHGCNKALLRSVAIVATCTALSMCTWRQTRDCVYTGASGTETLYRILTRGMLLPCETELNSESGTKADLD